MLTQSLQTGQIKSPDDIPEGDFRKTNPRFEHEHFQKNLDLVKELKKLAEKKGCTPGQIGIAWVRAQSGNKGMPTIIPIPGAAHEDRVNENSKNVTLSSEELAEVDRILKDTPISGSRYNSHGSGLLFGNSPPLKE